jgi:site-specific DNA-methyltransferase (cytosine-N4-specific)
MLVTDRDDDKVLYLGVQFFEGDALTVLGTLPDKAANCAVTSPPFFGSLRDYGNLALLGRETTIEDYLAGAVAMFRELRRVLTDNGSLWVHMTFGADS